MQLYHAFDDLPSFSQGCWVSIGNFDGVHLGHQAVLLRLVEKARSAGVPSVVLTFENHPSTILRPEKTPQQISSLLHRLKLIEQCGVDGVLLLKFTEQFAQQTAEEFLEALRVRAPFHGLILGYDSVIGKNRQGDRQLVEKHAQKMGFSVEYLAPLEIDGKTVSSTRIRQTIQSGELTQAQKLLGRSLTFIGSITEGKGIGKTLGFPTANMELGSSCIPPYGVYAVHLCKGSQTFSGVANLGLAPTMGERASPILETFLFHCDQTFYGEEVEVKLEHFIRPEKKFRSKEELTAQIAEDVSSAKELLSAT